jgi:hypothetical protein
MRQSWLGSAWEFVSYGQGSLSEKQAIAMTFLAHELADEFGYTYQRTWGEVFRGKLGRFAKRQE